MTGASARRPMRIGIACYPTFGGSGIVATELGTHLAKRDYQVHFISLSLPHRLHEFTKNVFFHEVVVEPYPLFQSYVPLSLALATKMSEVAENHRLDLIHVHYVMPFSASAYLARELVKPKELGIVTTLHGTDITVVGQQPAFYRMTKFTIESSDRVTSVSRFLRDATIETLGISLDPSRSSRTSSTRSTSARRRNARASLLRPMSPSSCTPRTSAP